MAITNTPFSGVQYLKNVNGRPILNDPRLKTLLSPWQYAPAEQEYAAPPLNPASLQSIRGWRQANAKILAAGGTVLGGTDNPIGIGNLGTVVAASVMAHTGLSNYQTLRAFTVEPAKVMGVLVSDRDDSAGDGRRYGHHPWQPAAGHRDDRER